MDSWLSAGWRYANGNEISQLFTINGGQDQFSPQLVDDSHRQATSIVRQLGVCISINNPEGTNQFSSSIWDYPTQITSIGWFNDGTDNSTVGLAELSVVFKTGSVDLYGQLPNESAIWGVYPDAWLLTASNGNNPPSGYGIFLVRNTIQETYPSVPEPVAYAMMLVGLTIFFFLAYRRNAV